MDIKWIGSPNYTKGRGGKKPTKIILHWMVSTLESADATFQKTKEQTRDPVSAHYGIGDTEIHQYVKDEDTAWHSGNSTVNKETIGIETEGGWLVGGTRVKPTELTHQTTARLIADICKLHSIPIDKEHIYGHSKVVPTECPGSLDIDYIIQLAKQFSEGGEDMSEIEELKKTLEEVRNSRDEWKKKYNALEKELEELKDIQDDTIEAISQKFLEQIVDLQDDVDSYKETLSKIELEMDRLQILVQAMEIQHSEELGEMKKHYEEKLEEKFEDKSTGELFVMFWKSVKRLVIK